MSYTPTKYPHGTFSWCDVASTDFPKTKEFLTKLFGWEAEDMPTEKGKPDYTMFKLNDKYTAGGAPTFVPQMPSFWTSYIKVDNVDEVVSKVESLGGKVTMPAMDVLDSGRMAVIQDPTGANVGLWQPKNFQGAGIVNTIGAMSWNELYTKDMDAAKDFYTKLLGWTYEVDEKNNNYTMIRNNNGRSNGGIFPITAEMGQMPPMWLVYFTVADINEATKKATALGGKVWMEIKEISVGKIASVSDPTGAAMMLIEMTTEPAQWEEK